MDVQFELKVRGDKIAGSPSVCQLFIFRQSFSQIQLQAFARQADLADAVAQQLASRCQEIKADVGMCDKDAGNVGGAEQGTESGKVNVTGLDNEQVGGGENTGQIGGLAEVRGINEAATGGLNEKGVTLRLVGFA